MAFAGDHCSGAAWQTVGGVTTDKVGSAWTSSGPDPDGMNCANIIGGGNSSTAVSTIVRHN